MELREFIKETISQISQGIVDAGKVLPFEHSTEDMQGKGEPYYGDADTVYVNMRIRYLFGREIMPRPIGVDTVSAFQKKIHKTFFNSHNLWIL